MKYAKKDSYPSDSIQLDEHLTIKIDSAWHTSDAGMFMGFYCYLNYFILKISTYVDKIKMATYQFQLDIENNEELYRRWDCEEKEIFHYMPNQFIDLMNEWSKQIVSEFDEKRNKKKEVTALNKKRKYDNEESILNKYRQNKSFIWEGEHIDENYYFINFAYRLFSYIYFECFYAT